MHFSWIFWFLVLAPGTVLGLYIARLVVPVVVRTVVSEVARVVKISEAEEQSRK
jgi:hypothetical protein